MTLAEARAELERARALRDAHQPKGCPGCMGAPRGQGGRCAEFRALRERARELAADVASWFAPAPGDEALFTPEEVSG